MANNDHKFWSDQYAQFIYRDENGNWMIDEFGPTDEFSLVRELRREQQDLRSEQSSLNPKGPIPTDEESRNRAKLEDDMDALNFALIEEEISNLDLAVQDELYWEQQVSFGKEGGRPGMDMQVFLDDLQSVYKALEAVAQNNPYLKITSTRIAQELIDNYGYDRSRKYLAEQVSNALKK